MKVFCAYDSKVEKYLRPFYADNTKQGVHAIVGACTDKESDFNKYPYDFVFFELGEFDEESAKFNLLNAPHSLGLAKDFIRSAPSVRAEQPTKSA